jgi:hypothetical protein
MFGDAVMGSRVTLYAGDLLLRHASDHAKRRCLYGSCAEQYGAGCRLLQRGFRARNILASAIGRFIEDFDLPNLKDEWALSMSSRQILHGALAGLRSDIQVP